MSVRTTRGRCARFVEPGGQHRIQ